MSDECNGGKKDIIMRALAAQGTSEANKLMKCIAEGKVSIDGCSTFALECNKVLQTLMDREKPTTPEEVRKFVNKAGMAIHAENLATTGKKANEKRFYSRLEDVLAGFERTMKDREVETRNLVEQQIQTKEYDLERLKRRLERLK